MAFVKRVNADPDEQTIPTTLADNLAVPGPVGATRAQEIGKDKREISLGLRFRVLHRDRFKCVLCGDSPAINLSCVLHVDHIVPWSKGGPTAIDNLRSLCGSCNLGRSNKYEDYTNPSVFCELRQAVPCLFAPNHQLFRTQLSWTTRRVPWNGVKNRKPVGEKRASSDSVQGRYLRMHKEIETDFDGLHRYSVVETRC